MSRCVSPPLPHEAPGPALLAPVNGTQGEQVHVEEHRPWDGDPFRPPEMSHAVGQKPTEESLRGLSCLLPWWSFLRERWLPVLRGGFLDLWHRRPAARQLSDSLVGEKQKQAAPSPLHPPPFPSARYNDSVESVTYFPHANLPSTLHL